MGVRLLLPLRLLTLSAIALLPVIALSAQGSTQEKDKSEDSKLQPKSRVYLLRGLTSEYAVVRKTLPRGSQGLHIKSDGQIDERNLQIQITNLGPAARPGEMVMISKLDLRKDAIVLDINGGAKSHGHWYDRIQVSGPIGGGVTQQQEAEQTAGSVITIDFGRPLPDMTVEEVKAILAPVLDFNQRSATLILTDTWPPEVQEAVKNHTIAAGMSRDQVLASRGRPDNKIRERKGMTDQETWIYGTVPAKVLLVTFEGDEVVEAHEFIPGIPATKVPREGDPPASVPVPAAADSKTAAPKPPQ
jgi:hypothetical protein